MSQLKQIGAVASELGVNPKTIHYYEEIGLVPKAQRNQTGYRVYSQTEIDPSPLSCALVPGFFA